jgi:hypothetical protein
MKVNGDFFGLPFGLKGKILRNPVDVIATAKNEYELFHVGCRLNG